MNDLVARIQDTIDKKAISYIARCDTPHEMLRKLKSKYCPTEATRKIELAAKFRRQLSIAPKTKGIEDWLMELERLYTQCKDKNVLAIDPGVTVKEFIDAVSTIDQAFADQ